MSHFRYAHPVTPDTTDEMYGPAIATHGEQRELEEALNELAAPIYTTDSQGRVTFFNAACTPLSELAPIASKDRWHGSWILCDGQGAPLAQDAIRDKHEIRGLTAQAERADGTRVTYRPYPTPLFDAMGDAVGAVNILIDIGDRRQIARLRDQADRCRQLSRTAGSLPTLETLTLMAEEYDEKARCLSQLN